MALRRAMQLDPTLRSVHNPERAPERAFCRLYARRCLAVAAITAMALAFSCGRAMAQESEPTEYQLKAVFLFNFTQFIDWPSSSFAGREAPFSVCILGDDPFGPVIDELFRGRSIDGHPMIVQRVGDAPQLRPCQVAFISASEMDHLREILQSVRGANVLLVGETPGFAAAGGAIQFQMQDDRVRLSINPDAAERAGLRVSSKLLSLATIIHEAKAAKAERM